MKRRTDAYLLRLSEQERKQLEMVAYMRGETISEALRNLVAEACQKGKSK